MNEAIRTITKGNYKLEIFNDDSPFSPREDDNLGTMVCFHGRYNLGDDHEWNANDYRSWEEQKKAIVKNVKPCVILPLYLYDHGGITISTSPFGCQWDSGQIGWIFVSKEKVKKEYGVKKITEDIIKRVTLSLEIEVDEYDDYLTGNIYGYKVSKIVKCDLGCEHEEKIDSCWGFHGIDYCEEEGMEVINRYTEKELV